MVKPASSIHVREDHRARFLRLLDGISSLSDAVSPKSATAVPERCVDEKKRPLIFP